ncbi:plastocyanin/azurin family copper-binding protein [Azospirillum sp. B4]|uniref:cupredoxin domain-containing protein n=1 Tax=Azospirillum sp. B4 TaxID=95605 RepID=UPI0003458ACF|nr:plastocyanin/azurin family copper-binding protein [Azospirillum sp. B4]
MRAYLAISCGCLALVAALSSTFDAKAATVVVTQKGRAFVPAQIKIMVGDTVIFRNEDVVPHHVVSHTPLFPFDLDLEQPGQERSQTFTQAGQVIVGCDLHSSMEVVVDVVKAAP